MSRRYTFVHTCGHIGIGPLINPRLPETDMYGLTINQAPVVDNIQLQLPFACPFCNNSEAYSSVEPGSGVLAILTSPPDRPFDAAWEVLYVCYAEDMNSRYWDAAQRAGGTFRQMAWIPKPCGQVHLSRVRRRTRPVMGVTSGWSQSRTDPVRSRIPGMLSQLNAAMSSREVAELGNPRLGNPRPGGN